MNLTPEGRYHYLDNLRIMAMLLGIFVHAATLGDFGWIEGIAAVSDAFRMALFFLISGFLGAMLLLRKGRTEFLRGRLRNLGVPLLFGLLILNPITYILIFRHVYGPENLNVQAVADAVAHYKNGDAAVLVWHLHLWFLFSLIAFVLTAPLIQPILSRYLGDRIADPSAWQERLVAWTAFAAVIGLSIALKLALSAFEVVFGEPSWLIEVTLRYLPFYAAGMALFISPTLRKAVIGPHLVMGVLAWGAYALLHFWDPQGTVGKVGWLVVMAAVRWWCCVFLLWVGQKYLSFSNRYTRFLSGAIYSVYLLHYLLIYALANLYASVAPIDALAYWLLSFGAIAAGLAVHAFVVTPSPLLTYLLNGRGTLKRQVQRTA